ncbi:hypothetical protein K4K49_005755 [Colletotrichum sp. SAR 10_70]|nr:hypothetical protein K4K50_013262 [Colletotrichum sp. SAR 10_71]KAI8165789.1 hypothetical protein K4K49_005755 [Colletotrichum sp. SAR 10_70]
MASSSKNAGSQPGQKPAAVANTKVAHEAQTSGPLAQKSPSSMSSRAAGVGISDAKATLKGGGDPEDEAAASLHSVGSQAVQEVQRQTLHERPSTTAARGHIAEDSGLGGMDETGHDGMGVFNSNDESDDDGNEYDAGNAMGNDPVEDDDISAEKAGVASAKKHVPAQSDGSLNSSSEYDDCETFEERSGPRDKESQQAPGKETVQSILKSGASSYKPGELAIFKQTQKNVGETERGIGNINAALSEDARFEAFRTFLKEGYFAVKTAMDVDGRLHTEQLAATKAAADADKAMTGITGDIMSRLTAIQKSACSDTQLSLEA